MLKAQVEQSYLAHPAFRGGSAWRVKDAAPLAAFSMAFEYASMPGNGAKATRELEICRASMATLLGDLRQQAEDESQRCFIDELERECQRWLGEQFGHFARQREAVGPDPLGALAQALVGQLERQRHAFGRIGASVLRDMLDVSAEALAKLRQRAAAGQLTREALSINSGPVVHALGGVLNREFDRLGVLDAISAYAHRPMRVTGLALELSVPQAHWWRNGLPGLERAPKTLYAHLDESAAVPKAIVYLSDVGPDNGPTGCYPGAYEDLALHPLQDMIGRVVGNVGSRPASPLHTVYAKTYHQSMTSEAFRHHYMKLPPALRFNSHLGWDILPDSDAETTLAAREQRLTGPAGSFIAFDGARLLHRGGLLQGGERVALQVMFSQQSLLKRGAKRLRYALPWA